MLRALSAGTERTSSIVLSFTISDRASMPPPEAAVILPDVLQIGCIGE